MTCKACLRGETLFGRQPYRTVEADDLAGAQALADGHPYLSDGNGDYAIDIYELMPAPEM